MSELNFPPGYFPTSPTPSGIATALLCRVEMPHVNDKTYRRVFYVSQLALIGRSFLFQPLLLKCCEKWAHTVS